MARRATVIRQERRQAQNTLVVDAGNSLLNDRDPAKETQGRSSIEAYNLMGYDAMALGTLDVTYLTPDEIRQRISEAHFAIVSANAYIAGTQERIAPPYVVLKVQNHQVGILGLTESLVNERVTVTDPVQTAKEVLPELQHQAEIIIVLSRAGQEANRRLAEQVQGIDVIVCGTNDVLSDPLVITSTGAVLFHADWSQPGLAGERVGVGYLYFDKSGRLVYHEWRRVALDSTYADDETLQNWLKTNNWD